MDKSTRNAIERATQQARKLLEDDFSSQLEGTFDVLRSGIIASSGGGHLSARQQFQRGKIVAAIDHKRAAGIADKEVVTDYLRDAAFTTLNRFIALKMLEARELVQECITKGEQSAGYREFAGMAPGLALIPDAAGYRLYVESLFDEFSTEIKVLFDRRDPASVLWPKRPTFEGLLTLLNAPELAGIWGEDETIGWVYQFFNSGDERRKIREESSIPRNSRELAIRNQFFTPRYVVQFLVDNTLGRLWVEMHGRSSQLSKISEYLVCSGDEPLQARLKKDPRDLRILDPACGSGHFLLYAFDLLLAIFEEAWSADKAAPRSEVTGRTLKEDYPSLADLRRAVPGLIVEHNLYGVDIDPRCAQIAALAIWLRAQRAWKDGGVSAADRPQIRRTHIVVAEPMPGDVALANEFAARLDPPLLRDLFKKMIEETRLAGELGVLLKVEDGIAPELRAARDQFVKQREVGGFLPGLEPTAEQGSLDLSGIDDDQFFHEAEARIIEALRTFAEAAAGVTSVRRRLFADDTAQGMALIDVVRNCFDVVLMNPPFGEMTPNIQDYADKNYVEGRNDIYAAFVRRGISLAREASGYVGAITSRAFITGRDHRHFRRSLVTDKPGTLTLFLDLGAGVLDGAMVETAAYVIGTRPSTHIKFFDSKNNDKNRVRELLQSGTVYNWPRERFFSLPQADLLYELDDSSIAGLTDKSSSFEPGIGRVTFGLTTKDDFRFVRLRWEIPSAKIGKDRPWAPFAKGGEFSWFTSTTHLLVHQADSGSELAAFAETRDGNIASTRRSSTFYYRAAVCFSRRSQKGFSARRLRSNACFSDKSAVIVPEGVESSWLFAIAPVLASSDYQRLITAQSKFGSYEIGPIKTLPLPDGRAVEQRESWQRLYSYFDEIESADETSEVFRGMPSASWSLLAGWDQARVALVSGLRACDLTPDERVLKQIDQWIREKATRFDLDQARRSWAVGVAFGRFVQSMPGGLSFAELGAFEAAPARSPAMAPSDGTARSILVDDRGHQDDIVDAAIRFVAGCHEEDFRKWVRSAFFSEHLATYSRSRRAAPIYWQIGIPSGRYSVWLYFIALSPDDLFRVQTDYALPKLIHEERRLAELRRELGEDPNAGDRKLLVSQESLVEELMGFVDEVKLVAPLWHPFVDDGVVINCAPLWRLVSQNRGWQSELKNCWDELRAGKYDWSRSAMHFWPERVIPKCVVDRSLAIAHGFEDSFWTEDQNGKWQPRHIPTGAVEALVRERTSIAVKTALKVLIDAPVSNGQNAKRRRSSS